LRMAGVDVAVRRTFAVPVIYLEGRVSCPILLFATAATPLFGDGGGGSVGLCPDRPDKSAICFRHKFLAHNRNHVDRHAIRRWVTRKTSTIKILRRTGEIARWRSENW
jgi:hypothetical protein